MSKHTNQSGGFSDAAIWTDGDNPDLHAVPALGEAWTIAEGHSVAAPSSLRANSGNCTINGELLGGNITFSGGVAIGATGHLHVEQGLYTFDGAGVALHGRLGCQSASQLVFLAAEIDLYDGCQLDNFAYFSLDGDSYCYLVSPGTVKLRCDNFLLADGMKEQFPWPSFHAPPGETLGGLELYVVDSTGSLQDTGMIPNVVAFRGTAVAADAIVLLTWTGHTGWYRLDVQLPDENWSPGDLLRIHAQYAIPGENAHYRQGMFRIDALAASVKAQTDKLAFTGAAPNYRAAASLASCDVSGKLPARATPVAVGIVDGLPELDYMGVHSSNVKVLWYDDEGRRRYSSSWVAESDVDNGTWSSGMDGVSEAHNASSAGTGRYRIDALPDFYDPTKTYTFRWYDSESPQPGGHIAVQVFPPAGVRLASDGLDAISTESPIGAAGTFREMIVQTWRRFFKKAVLDKTGDTLKTYADDGATVLTTQATAASDTAETQGAAE